MAGTPGNRTQESYNNNCIYETVCPYCDQANIDKQGIYFFYPIPTFLKRDKGGFLIIIKTNNSQLAIQGLMKGLFFPFLIQNQTLPEQETRYTFLF